MNDGNKKHDGLEQKEVRDFLAKEMQEVWNNGYPDLEFAEKRLEDAKLKLEMARKGHAIKNILEKLGWEEHDVSDYEKYIEKEYFSFIGTEEEAERYIEKSKEK